LTRTSSSRLPALPWHRERPTPSALLRGRDLAGVFLSAGASVGHGELFVWLWGVAVRVMAEPLHALAGADTGALVESIVGATTQLETVWPGGGVIVKHLKLGVSEVDGAWPYGRV
jgi:hypothetical protein